MSAQTRLILASGSPRRRQLLTEAGIPFDAVVPTIGEPDEVMNKLPPTQQAEALAYFKARAVHDQYPSRWVLGADTIVARGGKLLGKPQDAAEARGTLAALAGTRHAVITGVVLLGPTGRLIASETTFVTMRKLSPAELEEYIASGQWQGKAGAYGLQEIGDRFVEKVEGSFSNVVGLPMELLARMIDQIIPKGGKKG